MLELPGSALVNLIAFGITAGALYWLLFLVRRPGPDLSKPRTQDAVHKPAFSHDTPTRERDNGAAPDGTTAKSPATYRLLGIPADVHEADISDLLRKAWEIPGSTEIWVHSLAINPHRPEEKVATVSFSEVPTSMQSSKDSTEWISRVNEELELVLDTHFRGFTPLHSGPDENCSLDCIAVSGLGGHPFGSFKSKNKSPKTKHHSFMWLRDALPRDLPQARIFIYGYDAESANSNSFGNIVDLGAELQHAIYQIRPSKRGLVRSLVLIAHSLGGLVVKEAVINMGKLQTEDDQINLQSLRAALFFGVPTLGMDIKSLIPMVEGKPNEHLVKSLDKTSDIPRRLQELFDQVTQRVPKYWYYETKKSPTARLAGTQWSMTGPETVLVDAHSATNGRSITSKQNFHFAEPINRTHSEIVKFPHTKDRYYLAVSGHLKGIEGGIQRGRNGRIRCTLTDSQSECVRSLAVENQETRQRSIDLVRGTCKWIRSHPIFQEWEGSRTEILWIRGYPGSGKSSLMKYLADTLDRETPNLAAPTLISFFFNGTSSEVHRSLFGFYSALLNQLLPEIPQFCHAIFEKYTQDRSRLGDNIGWQEKELRDFLSTILLEATSEGIPIIILADALDEAGESNATELLEFFRGLENTSKEDTNNVDGCLKICFSCRHYPIVMGQNHPFIIDVDHHNGADLSTFIRNKLTLDPSVPIEDNVLTEVQNEIISKTGRTFQWANLMIKEVRRILTRTGTMSDIQEHISKVPSDLHQLYGQLISPTGLDSGSAKYSPKDQALTLKLFQWLCFSKRPPTLATIQHALVLGPEELGIASVNEHPDFRPLKVMAARIIDLSRGLVEIRAPNAQSQSRSISKGEDSEKIIQFAHQSVYDFLLEIGLADLSGSEIAALEPTARVTMVTCLGHFQISRACIRAMALEGTRTFAENHLPLAQASQCRLENRDSHEMGSFKLSDCCYSFGFSGTFGSSGAFGRYSMMTMPVLPVKKLTTDEISTWIVQQSLGGKKQKHSLRLHPSLLQHSEQMIPVAMYGSKYLCYHLEAAETCGCDQSDLLELFSGPDLLSTWQGILRLAPRGKDDSYIFRAPSIPHVLARSGVASALGLCLKQNPRSCSISNDQGETPLHHAIEYGKHNVVKLFVKEPLERRCIYIDQSDSYGSTPLHHAIKYHRKEIVDTLIQEAQEYGTVNINHLDNEGRSPIFVAAKSNRVEDTRLLLSTNKVFTVTQKNSTGDTPLSAAAQSGCTEIASLLLKNGASVESRNTSGCTPLLQAARFARDEIAEYLVKEASADVHVFDNGGCGILSNAASSGHGPTTKYIFTIMPTQMGVEDKEGKLPIIHALEALHRSGDRGAFDFLKTRMSPHDEGLLMQTMRHAREELVAYVLEHEGPFELEILEKALEEIQRLRGMDMKSVRRKLKRMRDTRRSFEEIKQLMEKRRA